MQQRTRCRKLTLGLLSLGLLVGAALLAGPSQAATANGPYYANPAWDQKLPVATRFIVLTDWNSDAVLDRETGLVWEKAPTAIPAPPKDWTTARSTCVAKGVGNRMGWRLPSVHELASLIEPTRIPPRPIGIAALPEFHPFNTGQATSYWSATTLVGNPAIAWYVDFFDGGATFTDKAASFQIWCVRGGMNADAY